MVGVAGAETACLESIFEYLIEDQLSAVWRKFTGQFPPGHGEAEGVGVRAVVFISFIPPTAHGEGCAPW